ncbi:hypothetical protein [Paenibacillus spongiae]|uniref:Uncharacterized protein n=1 Tax=Paenibacillus spongiae TaxID=2909671 RepID=A0ABY5SGY8_9BACL|nr:hypothetical protein [Paenibacillus spongiae]UVI32735.1 hypothetical protein L1F29_13300 [Paenibacillus spongiae]
MNWKAAVAAVLGLQLLVTPAMQACAASLNAKEVTLNTMQINNHPAKYEPQKGTFLGAYILQDETIRADIGTFTERTDKQHASYFRNVGYGKPFPKQWVEQVKAAGGFPHISWEPDDGLEKSP